MYFHRIEYPGSTICPSDLYVSCFEFLKCRVVPVPRMVTVFGLGTWSTSVGAGSVILRMEGCWSMVEFDTISCGGKGR